MGNSNAARVACISAVVFAVTSVQTNVAFADDAAQARFHFERARRFYNQYRWEDALREFFIVNRLSPDAPTLFNIALCFDQLGRADQAFLYFSRFLQAESTADAQRAVAERRVERLRSKVAEVRVQSIPEGAEVYIDFREHGSWGRTPLTIPLSAGPHRIWLAKANHRDATVELRAALGEHVDVEERLTPILGKLAIESAPAGAEALVTDGEGGTVARGTTPFGAELPPGLYVIEVAAPGHRPERSVMKVEPDAPTKEMFVLEALPPPGGEVTVTANPPGSLVEVDGEPVGFAPAVLTDVELGLRDFRVSAAGTQPWEGMVDVRDEGRGYLTATLAPPPKTERSVATWVFGGIGGSALTAALVTGILALDANNEFESARADPDGTDLRQLKEEGETFAAVTDALLIAGGVSLLTGTILFFTTARESRPSEASVTWGAP